MLYVRVWTYSTLIAVAVLKDLYILFSSVLLSVIGSGRRKKDCTVFGTGLYSVCYRIVQCLVQRITQSTVNNQLSPMFALRVSMSTRSSSGRNIQRHRVTENCV